MLDIRRTVQQYVMTAGKLGAIGILGLLFLTLLLGTSMPIAQAQSLVGSSFHDRASSNMHRHVRQSKVQTQSHSSHNNASATKPGGVASGSNADITNMIYETFGPYAPSAMRIARCESGLNPNAYNPQPVLGSHAMGVFQILYPSTWMTTPQSASSPYNARANISAAHAIFARDGFSWREWQCQA
ncbi:MAG TPA: transglycosylase SLT domain-containing protein [Ktedonobacteraceae bacterium]|nr:transglycosylase SLT domain-containing protein [Ktedonobacteraceae bacterium]